MDYSTAMAAALAAEREDGLCAYSKKYSRKKNIFYSSDSDFQALGFDAKTTEKIRAKMRAGRIRSFADFAEIPGVDTQKLRAAFYPVRERKSESENTHSLKIVDLNIADTNDLAALPGIGMKTANRIVNFRNKLGGFYEVRQVLETKWTDSNALKTLLPRFILNPKQIKKIDLKTATAEQLAAHPYLSKKDANLIYAFCKQHQGFNLKNLQENPGISPLARARMEHYFIFF